MNGLRVAEVQEAARWTSYAVEVIEDRSDFPSRSSESSESSRLSNGKPPFLISKKH